MVYCTICDNTWQRIKILMRCTSDGELPLKPRWR